MASRLYYGLQVLHSNSWYPSAHIQAKVDDEGAGGSNQEID